MIVSSVFSRTRFDLVIVGGGIVGATLANLLADRCPNLVMALVDSAPAPALDLSSFDSRVVAISHASQAVFEALGIWHTILATRACAYKEMFVWDSEGTANIHFDCRHIHRPSLGHIIENSVLTHALYRLLATKANVECLNQVKVERVSVEQGAADSLSHKLVLDNAQEISAPLVVAADGAHSRLREWSEIDVRQWDYGHSAIVTTVKTAKPHKFTARQCFTENGPLAFLPLTLDGVEANHCSIVWSLKHEIANRIMALDEGEFCAELGHNFEYVLGDIVYSDQRQCFPLTQRNAKQYGRAGLALIGDAAHTIHPLAGQGANLGIADAAALADEIERACLRGLALSDLSVIKRYERRRLTPNLMAMSTMEGFKRLFGSDDIRLRWFRNAALRQVNSLSFIKNELAKLACD